MTKAFSKLIGKKCELNQMLEVIGDYAELQKLKDKLTLTNKSVSYQIKKATDQFKFWKVRHESERKNGGSSDYTVDKMTFYSKQIDELKEKLKKEYYYDTEDGKTYIPAGFWYLLGGVENDFHLNKDVKPYLLKDTKGFSLRDYQEEAVIEVLKYKRATCVMATGLGKSGTIASIALSFVKAGKRVFIVVPTEYLVGQFYETAKRFHDSVTSAGGGRHNKLGCDIFICTAQSAINHIGDFDVVLVDECHHQSATTWENLMMASDKAEYVYNFTATPFRTDGMDLAIHAFGGPTVFERNVAWGIANNWLTKPKVYQLLLNSSTPMSSSAMATSAYKKLVGNKKVYEVIRTQLLKALSAGRKVMIIFKTLPPAEGLKKYCAKDIKFNVANANFKKPLKDFKDGICNVLVATDKLISEGIDIPDADCLILLTQNSSDAITYQCVGRVLRKSPAKKDAIVIDVVTKGYKQFESAAEKRMAVYQKMTDEIKQIETGG